MKNDHWDKIGLFTDPPGGGYGWDTWQRIREVALTDTGSEPYGGTGVFPLECPKCKIKWQSSPPHWNMETRSVEICPPCSRREAQSNVLTQPIDTATKV